MAKRKTSEEWIEMAKDRFNNKFDYSKAKFTSSKEKVEIICPIHGSFYQTMGDHVRSTTGCVYCMRKKSYGVGVNDLPIDKGNKIALDHWLCILERCYNNKKNVQWYSDCTVCEEWHLFSNFKRWHDEHYVEGWDIDKDLTLFGNRVYCPEYCNYVPKEINYILLDSKGERGLYPIGVTKHTNTDKFTVKMKMGKDRYEKYGFLTPEDAFCHYKEKKEEYIKIVANKWKDVLTQQIYNNLINYEIKITD